MSWITQRLGTFQYPPRYGPEWGSGGIFGLKYYKGVLYFTLAFEAEAHFVSREGEKIYNFDLVGEGPRSGGDSYNASEAVDDEILFGGWVHAPAIHEGRVGRCGKINFLNKFSHLHSYDVSEDEVKLLWKDTIRHESEWAGEISEIIYDPVGDRLVVGRADGHRKLGIYSVERRSGESKLLTDAPGLKGTYYLDYVCFDELRDWRKGLEAIQTIDLVTSERSVSRIEDYSKISIDGGDVVLPLPGCAISAYSRIFFFIRGGVIVGDPLQEIEPLRFIRLFDFGMSGYSPTRTMAKPLCGGILVAFNAYTHGMIHPRDNYERTLAESTNFVEGPSVLLYITPPTARVIAALGARVTSIEGVGNSILLGCSTGANLGADDATAIDSGFRDISALNLDALLNSAPPTTVFVTSGKYLGEDVWGGIPLYGYKEPRILMKASKQNKITVYEYDLTIPPSEADSEERNVSKGKNIIDLSGFKGIVSFKFEKPDSEARVKIYLD